MAKKKCGRGDPAALVNLPEKTERLVRLVLLVFLVIIQGDLDVLDHGFA